MLGGQDAIHGIERKLTAAVQEIREVGLAQIRLPRQQGDADCASLYPAEQFQAESLVYLGKIHLWKIRHRQWGSKDFHCLRKSYQG
jgi:hypothetical protein